MLLASILLVYLGGTSGIMLLDVCFHSGQPASGGNSAYYLSAWWLL
jgi:hypothetical protein